MRSLNHRPAAGAAAACLLALALAAGPAPAAPAHRRAPDPAREATFRDAMRKLWEDHVTWTRLVIVSTAAGLPDLDATTQRLLKNQDDIGGAVAAFYGEAAGRKLTGLLRAHITGAAAVLGAAKAGDAAKLATAKKDWYANGDAIAAFLSGANPAAWPPADMRSMMKTHLDLTLGEAVDQLQGRYARSVEDYDKVHDEILAMSDMLADGIVRQFPAKFAQTAVAARPAR